MSDVRQVFAHPLQAQYVSAWMFIWNPGRPTEAMSFQFRHGGSSTLIGQGNVKVDSP